MRASFDSIPVRTCMTVILAVGMLHSASLANDLAPLSDEFDSPSSLANWLRINETEQWFADQLEGLDISTSETGRMVLMPYTVVWFNNWRGPLVYKEVTGDFVVTTDIRATGRDGSSVPQTQFSLAGLMIRTPRNITPATWTTGGENYIFLSMGHGNNGGSGFQFEVKTTTNSNSTLILSNNIADNALLQIARLGDYVIVLRKESGQPWAVHDRYNRSDMPPTLQVGAVAYTNWEKSQDFSPPVHNANVLNPPLPGGVTDPTPGETYIPDIIGSLDYIRFFRPTLPAGLVGVDLTDAGLVSDADLLAFLADNANVPAAGVPVIPTVSTWGMVVTGLLVAMMGSLVFRGRSYFVNASPTLG